MSPRVLTPGETMALLDPVEDRDPRLGMRLVLRVAGAESNFGIALSRLGVQVTWVSRLGADPLGDIVHEALAAEGLDLRFVRRDPSAPTGVFFKWRSGLGTRVLYYRRGSAASRLCPEDVPEQALDGAALVHLTGITMALSDSARALALDLARRARARGITVLFDPNWRPALWSSPGECALVQREVLSCVDWYLCGLEEGCLLFGTQTPEELADAVRAAGAGEAVVRVGARGAVVRGETVSPRRQAAVLDEVGAGDGFAAGFAYGLLQGWAPRECARLGNVIAAAALAGTGDWETYPRLEEIRAELPA